MATSTASWALLERRIVACERCPRLRAHCTEVARVRRRAYRDQPYWGRPVPGFGDPQACILLLGLAPAAQLALGQLSPQRAEHAHRPSDPSDARCRPPAGRAAGESNRMRTPWRAEGETE